MSKKCIICNMFRSVLDTFDVCSFCEEGIEKPKNWKDLSYQTKLKILNERKDGASYTDISKKYNVKYLSIKSGISNFKSKIKKGNGPETIINILNSKISKFCKGTNTFSAYDLLDNIGPEPKCYITKSPINLTNKKSYSLDHIIPVSKGGSSTLDNCGLCLTIVNLSKGTLSLEEYIELSRIVYINNKSKPK